jgi:hypothetical protein
MKAVSRWSWHALCDSGDYDGPAVYAVRVLNEGRVCRIPRFLGTDPNGILTIGMTTNFDRRRRQFIRGMNHGRGHTAANLLYPLKTRKLFHSTIPEPSYQICFRRAKDEANARSWEELLTRQYVRRFGEAPPLTSLVPNRYAHLATKR